MSQVDEMAPLFLKRPTRGITTAGQWVWTEDDDFDLEYHFRHSALPKPGRVRELLELCSRLHSTRLARERPLWEAHLIEGLRDGRVALYTKLHHSLVDGISAMRLLQSVMTTDPDKRDMPPMWAARPGHEDREGRTTRPSTAWPPYPSTRCVRRSASPPTPPGLPAALIKTLKHGLRNETSALSLYAPRTMFNTTITGSRRFAAAGLADRAAAGDRQGQRHHPQRRRAGDVLRRDPRPTCSSTTRCPTPRWSRWSRSGLNAKQSQSASGEGGNAVGAVMVKLGTDLRRPGRPARLDPRVDEDRQGGAGLDDASCRSWR